MSQIFHPSTNTIAKVSIFGAVFFLAVLGWFGATWVRSSYMTGVNVARAQDVPFSHKHHVDGLGIDCRFCHTAVEESSSAGIPPTKTCMKCHSVIWNDSPMLEPVRESYRTGIPLKWNRVHALPDFVFFNHSVHVAKGVACVSCHGQVNEMPLMRKTQTLHMEWCLSCHRAPEEHLRPRDEVTNMHWNAAAEKKSPHPLLSVQDKSQLTNCSVCHR